MSDHGQVEIRPGLTIPDDVLTAFCRRHGINRLAVFGSVLGDDFGEESDVDVLVEFLPGREPGLLHLASMELELGEVLGREVELRTYEDLSRYFRDRVREVARHLYAA